MSKVERYCRLQASLWAARASMQGCIELDRHEDAMDWNFNLLFLMDERDKLTRSLSRPDRRIITGLGWLDVPILLKEFWSE